MVYGSLLPKENCMVSTYEVSLGIECALNVKYCPIQSNTKLNTTKSSFSFTYPFSDYFQLFWKK